MVKKNRPDIPEKTIVKLWLLSGGRCQYDGCNTPLWRDELTLSDMNSAYIAHIIDVNPQTHRYDKELSPKLTKDLSNLMLLCDTHHRLIDREGEKDHPVERLQKMKKIHEERIELVTSIRPEKKSHILLYGANIGEHSSPLNWHNASLAMMPEWYPANPNAIELSLKNCTFKDHELDYWKFQIENLRRQFKDHVKPRLADEIKHISIFGLAPIPLLIELGRLISDIPSFEIYQLHREPQSWSWHNVDGGEIIIKQPEKINKKIALVISLSATITPDRISSCLGDNFSIWTITVSKPNNDLIKSRKQLIDFREKMRLLLNEIKAKHGKNNEINVFPAMGVSTAISFGQIWMPKADLPLNIFEENKKHENKGFMYVHTIL